MLCVDGIPVQAALYWVSLYMLHDFIFGYSSNCHEFQPKIQSFKYVFGRLDLVYTKLYRRKSNPHSISVRLEALAVCQRDHYGTEIP